MRQDVIFVLKKMALFVGYALVVSALTGLLFIDIHMFGDKVQEGSLTEIAQELMLLVMVMLHLWLGMKQPALRYSSVLIAGFFACALVRELDFAFDQLRHGSWVYAALTITALCLVVAASKPGNTLKGLVVFVKHPSYGILCAGLLNILVFSRLLGMGTLWHALLQEHHLRLVKNVVEEGSELFGYGLCLLASVHYFFDNRRLSGA